MNELSKSVKKRLNVQQGIPIGATCHYEKQGKDWYVVWGADFEGDSSGKTLVEYPISFYLQCGYEIGKSEGKES